MAAALLAPNNRVRHFLYRLGHPDGTSFWRFPRIPITAGGEPIEGTPIQTRFSK
jgi:hypothetical protein